MVASLKVVENEPAAPMRRDLAEAIEARKATMQRYVDASASVDRLRSLIAAETTAKSALAELEKKATAGAAAWARGETESLDIPSQKEIDTARREIEHAARLADAARAALPGIEADARAAAQPHTDAIAGVVAAIHAVLYAEAETIRAEQIQHEARAAECSEQLIAIGSALRANPVPNSGSHPAWEDYWRKIAGWVAEDRPRAEARSSIATPRPDLAATYLNFVGCLARDPTATLEGLQS